MILETVAALADLLTDPVAVVDQGFVVRYRNDAFRRLSAWADQAAVDHIYRYFADQDWARLRAELFAELGAGRTQHVGFVSELGAVTPVSVRAARLGEDLTVLVCRSPGAIEIDDADRHRLLAALTGLRSGLDEIVEDLVARQPDAAVDLGLLESLGLTARERSIVVLVAKGQSNKQIADNLNLAEITVKKHVSSIFSKVGVANRVQLVGHVRGMLRGR